MLSGLMQPGMAATLMGQAQQAQQGPLGGLQSAGVASNLAGQTTPTAQQSAMLAQQGLGGQLGQQGQQPAGALGMMGGQQGAGAQQGMASMAGERMSHGGRLPLRWRARLCCNELFPALLAYSLCLDSYLWLWLGWVSAWWPCKPAHGLLIGQPPWSHVYATSTCVSACVPEVCERTQGGGADRSTRLRNKARG